MALDLTPTLTGNPWDAIGPGRFGSSDDVLVSVPTGGSPGTANAIGAHPPVWSPQNPLFWFGGLLLATGFGLFAVGGNVRVGKTKASASIGEA
jgi:hypothetical protein